MTALPSSCADCLEILGASNSWNPKGLSRPYGVNFVTIYTSFPSLAQQPNASHGRLFLEVCTSHTMTHHSRYDFSRRGIGPSQRPVLNNHRTVTRHRHSCARWDSNPKSHHAIGRRPSPYTARPTMCGVNYMLY